MGEDPPAPDDEVPERPTLYELDPSPKNEPAWKKLAEKLAGKPKKKPK
jgi:hypothetical protein